MALIIEPGIRNGAAIKRVAFLTGLSQPDAFGRLAGLWEESQKLGRVNATADEIGFWLGAETLEQARKWVDAFADPLAGFLKRLDDGSLEIRGNAKHIEKRDAISERNRKIALSRVKKSTPGDHHDTSTSPHGDQMESISSKSSLHLDTLYYTEPSYTEPSQAKLNQAEPSQAVFQNSENQKQEKKNAPTRLARANPRGCISQFSGDPILEQLLSGVTNALQATWLSTYCDETEWIKQELKKANAWIVANPRKAPKDFGRFMTNWLAQGWESHRKGIPSRRLTTSELNMQSIGDLYRKVQAEG